MDDDFADKAAIAILDEMKSQLMVDVRRARPYVAKAIRARDAAWARLVAAHIGAANAAKGQSDILADLAAKDIESAEQALRDLGVDAGALILEAIDDPSLFRSTAG